MPPPAFSFDQSSASRNAVRETSGFPSTLEARGGAPLFQKQPELVLRLVEPFGLADRGKLAYEAAHLERLQLLDREALLAAPADFKLVAAHSELRLLQPGQKPGRGAGEFRFAFQLRHVLCVVFGVQ